MLSTQSKECIPNLCLGTIFNFYYIRHLPGFISLCRDDLQIWSLNFLWKIHFFYVIWFNHSHFYYFQVISEKESPSSMLSRPVVGCHDSWESSTTGDVGDVDTEFSLLMSKCNAFPAVQPGIPSLMAIISTVCCTYFESSKHVKSPVKLPTCYHANLTCAQSSQLKNLYFHHLLAYS